MRKITNLMLLLMMLLSSSVIFAQCDYQIELTDPGYGDGWNGGRVTVYVNGVAVLTDITLNNGYGPEYHTFAVPVNGVITTDYTPGGWSYENHYNILDPNGVAVFLTGHPYGEPQDLLPPGLVGCPPQGDVDGHVYGADASSPIQGAEVGVEAYGVATHSGADGSYLLPNVTAGEATVYCKVPGVNMSSATVTIPIGGTVTQDFYIVPPNVSSQPNSLEETLNPNEYLTSNVTLFNMGDGDAYWTAEIVDGGTWLSVGEDQGIVPANGNLDVSVVFNAEGTTSGDVFNGEIRFIIHPEVDTVVVPATMIVIGDPLSGVTDLNAVIGNMLTGKVNLSWNFSRTPAFQYFGIERDGQTVGTTTDQFYSDMLPDYGTYSYKVFPVYDEGKGLPGGPEEVIWGIPELTWMPATLEGDVWANTSEVFPLTMKNTGEGMLHFEFTGFDDPYFNNSYITSVSPYSGDVLAGDSMIVYVTFDADGFGNGSHSTDLVVATNELAPNDSHNIPTTMNVTTPGTFTGVVTDCDNGSQLGDVEVIATNQADNSVYTAQTIYNGSYTLDVSAGDYDIVFHKVGYDDFATTATATEGNTTTVDGQLCVTPYPVSWVTAQVNDPDTKCYVEWSVPMGPYEIIYDDGSAEDYVIFVEGGGAGAVRCTPAGYPATVTGGRVYVGDGSFPVNGANFLGTDISVGILDDDGPNNGPGTVLDSTTITINNYGWVEFNGIFNRTFNDGDFYLAVWQLNGADQSAPIGIDNQAPTSFRSYAKAPGFDWVVSSYQDMMIRPTVSGPNQGITMNANPNRLVHPVRPLVKCYLATGKPNLNPGYMKAAEYKPLTADNNLRGFASYKLARLSGFDPNAGESPKDGTKKFFPNLTVTHKTDNQFGGLDMGWYAYGVKAKYETGNSKWVYSNIVGHLMDVSATFTVDQCDGLTPNNVEVTMTAQDYPHSTYFGISGDDGIVYFDSIIKGTYNIRIFKVGYQPQELVDMLIMDDYTYSTTLQENAYPVRNLYVDALTSVATWDEPLITQIYKTTFEDPTFPPEGWQSSTLAGGADPGWYRSSIADGKVSNWIIPDWEGHYAVTNDDYNGSDMDASMDYLITPPVDLRESDDFAVYFDRFFTGGSVTHAYIEYSTNNGVTWTALASLAAYQDWKHDMVDLSAISGADGLSKVWIAFHYDDGGDWIDGWAIDNVEIHNGAAPVLGYRVYLDNAQVAELPADVRTYAFGDLVYGTTYTASVRAKYGCELSEPRFYTWQSTYLYPPRNLADAYVYNTNEVPLMWNPPITGDGVPMMASSLNINADFVRGTAALNIGSIPSDGVAVVAPEKPTDASRDEVVTVYGISNDLNAYASFSTDDFATINQIAPYTLGNFVNASEFKAGSTKIMYFVDNTGAVQEVNVETGDVVDLGTISVQPTGMALDYSSGVYYLVDADNLYTFDVDNMTTTMVGPMVEGSTYIGLTCDGYGNLWAYDLGTDSFYSLDKNTGAATLVGNIGFDANFGQGMGYDEVNDQVVMACFNNASFQAEYRSVDLATGNTTLLGVIGTSGATQFGTIALPASGGGPGGTVPAGLVSFNVYRNDSVVGNAPYNGESPNEFIHYVDNPVMPGTYFYEVSALYDLAQFGFPGEIGESALEGVDTVTVIWGMDLPFSEDWKTGNFDFNNWSSDATNWRINSQVGDDAPSAEFTWDPLLENDYAASLTTAPLKADMLSEGDIWLDYNLKLDDRNSTGVEHMIVEVFDGETWNQVSDVANNGSFDFADGFNHIKISNYAKGKVFQVRFTATGMNSFDVISWFVDNINVYRSCAGPTDLEGKTFDVPDVEADAIRIKWQAPEIPVSAQWFYYDNETVEYVWGGTDAWDADVAIKIDAADLVNFEGAAVTKCRAFLDGRLLGVGTVSIKILQGENPDPSNPLYEEDVTSQFIAGDDWNEFTLSQAVPIDYTQSLWIDLYTSGPADTYGAGITEDMGSYNPNGDMYWEQGAWKHIVDLGISNRAWLLRGYVTTSYGSVAMLGSNVGNTSVVSGLSTAHSFAQADVNGSLSKLSSEREFTGFKVYRSRTGHDGTYAELATVPYEEGVTAYQYEDMMTDDDLDSTFWYKVSAIWGTEGADQCESAYAPRKNMPIYDFVSVMVTSVDNPLAGTIGVYPNPATTNVTVSTTEGMNKVTVINYVGQVVYQKALNGENSVDLNTSNYDAGVYVIRIETANGTTNKRVVITK